jgi:hypothetical protein
MAMIPERPHGALAQSTPFHVAPVHWRETVLEDDCYRAVVAALPAMPVPSPQAVAEAPNLRGKERTQLAPFRPGTPSQLSAPAPPARRSHPAYEPDAQRGTPSCLLLSSSSSSFLLVCVVVVVAGNNPCCLGCFRVVKQDTATKASSSKACAASAREPASAKSGYLSEVHSGAESNRCWLGHRKQEQLEWFGRFGGS